MDFEKDHESIQDLNSQPEGISPAEERENYWELHQEAQAEQAVGVEPGPAEPEPIPRVDPQPVWEPEPRVVLKPRSRLTILAWVLIGAIIGSSLTFGAGYYYLPQLLQARGINFRSGQGQNITIQPLTDLSVYTAVAQKAMPSVVGITTTVYQRTFFGTQALDGVGTGVVVDARGYILTNSHVVEGGQAESILVTLYDGTQVKAQVVWQDENLDLAVIKVESDVDLEVAELGDSDILQVGEIAVAIGNPLGLTFERSLTQGVISGLNRSIDVDSQVTIENLIQTDASINPGNSGGPLLNAQGQVIGINTAKIQSGEGLGFAIPINMAKPIVEEIIENGEFSRVVMGISGINVDVFEAYTGTQLQAEEGVYIAEVIANSAAERAGMQAGDVITVIGNKSISTMSALQRELYQYRPGDTTAVTLLRNGREVELNITFQSNSQ